MPRATLALFAVVAAILSTGCSSQRTVRTSLVDYLYPEASAVPEPAQQAMLRLPVDVGIAFVPRAKSDRYGYAGQSLPGADQEELLRTVKASFAGKPWVRRIEIVPETYLSAGGGFANVEQVARLFRVDVMVLCSIDQAATTRQTPWAVTYLTIAGAYLVPGDRLETRTLIDAAAFDVRTRTFLLRAPGRSASEGIAPGAVAEGQTLAASRTGFGEAMADLARNLDAAVERFAADVRSGERTDVEVMDREGRSLRTGGALGIAEAGAALGLLLLAGLRRWTGR